MKNYLLNYLQPYFEHKKYEEGKLGIDFIRKTSFGHSCIQCLVTEYSDGMQLRFFAGIRNDLLERTLNHLLGENLMRYDGITSLMVEADIIQSGKKGTQFRFFCQNKNDARKASDVFIDLMDRKGFDFLDHYKSVDNIDYLYNDKPRLSANWTNNSYIRCFRAMTTAKILGRKDYDRLFLMHQQYLAERGFKGMILEKFNRTFARLKSVSLN
jgi:hypothetical protein